MAGINKAIIIGRLGRDPEVRYTPAGLAVANISVATSEEWRDKETGEKKERTEWHRVIVFGKRAEVCGEYLSKGRQIYVEGRLQTRSWEQDGVTRYTTEIVANDIQFLGDRGTANSSQPSSSRPSTGGGGGFADSPAGAPPYGGGAPEDDIPF